MRATLPRENIVRLILDGKVVKTRVDRKATSSGAAICDVCPSGIAGPLLTSAQSRSKTTPAFRRAEGVSPNIALKAALRCAEEAKPAEWAASVKLRPSASWRAMQAIRRQIR